MGILLVLIYEFTAAIHCCVNYLMVCRVSVHVLLLSVHCTATYVSLYYGFASPTREPQHKLCGRLSFDDSKIETEYKSTTFRVVIRYIPSTQSIYNQINIRIILIHI